jgi:hypothetical protein
MERGDRPLVGENGAKWGIKKYFFCIDIPKKDCIVHAVVV